MTANLQSSVDAKTSAANKPRYPIARLIGAAILTIGLAYPGAFVMVWWMMTGELRFTPFTILIAETLAVMVLTRGLSASFDQPRFHGLLALALAACWFGIGAALVWLRVGTLIPRVYVFLLMSMATLWLPWLAWIPYGRPRLSGRLRMLAVLLVASAVFPAFLKVNDLTGEADLNFAWRWTGHQRELATAVASAGIALSSTPHDYAQYLGPQRLAVLPEAHLGRAWQQRPPRQVWRHDVGEGWGAFVVVGDYAITQEQRGPDECVVCYRLADGAVAWIHSDPVRFDNTLGGPGPRATPTIVDGRAYTIGAKGLLNCLNGADGKVLWSVNVLEDNQGAMIAHGVCGSPLVVEKLVVVCPTGCRGVAMAAYERDTGKRFWQAGPYQASYSSPLLAELLGVRQILLYADQGVMANDVATGQSLWTYPWTNDERINCSQPIPNAGGPGQVFVSTEYGRGCALFRVERTGAASWSTRTLWEKRQSLKTKFTTPVQYQGCVYGLDQGILECLDLATGRRLWKDGRYQHGQILLAGDLLLVQAENGDVVLVEPAPDRLRELGRLQALSSKTWNHLALAGRFLLVRNDREATCYELPLRQE